MPISLSIIIVTWNSRSFLQECIDSIYAEREIDLEVIVVDNASTDDTIAYLEKTYPKIKTISNSDNRGFAAACNQGLREAEGRYALLLNPDTKLYRNSLKQLVTFMEAHPKAGIVGGRVLNPDGSLQAPCRRRFPSPANALFKFTGLSRIFGFQLDSLHYEMEEWNAEQSHPVDAVSGSCLLLRREVWEQVGGLDEDFFIFGEDLDYCYRVRQAGWQIFYCADAPLVHYRGQSRLLRPLPSIIESHEAMRIYYRKHLATQHGWLLRNMIENGISLRKWLIYGLNYVLKG